MCQLPEDLPQEMEDNQQDPDGRKAALIEIIAAYNSHYGTNHRITDFDAYYQDIQTRIKSQQFPNSDTPGAGENRYHHRRRYAARRLQSKYLDTLYDDKSLKYHGLIQALSRTNRVLNDTKPFGNILDFRQQQDAVDDAIKLFSGEYQETAREIWLVDPAPTVMEKNCRKPSKTSVPSCSLTALRGKPRTCRSSRATSRKASSSRNSRKSRSLKPSSTNTPISARSRNPPSRPRSLSMSTAPSRRLYRYRPGS